MTKIYMLKSDSENYSFFLEQSSHIDNKFIKKYWGWKHINLESYEPVNYKLYSGDNGRKNYHMDISSYGNGLIIFSEKSIEILREILESSGQMVPIITESKRKKFLGFYANKNIYDDSIINLNKSEFNQYENGKLFYKIVLNKCPENNFIFVLASEPTKVFVTEEFKNLVEKYNLQGFDFSEFTEIKIEY